MYPPREHVTLVEVQACKKNYQQAHLSDHHDKMQQVGAGHLVVVSTAGFADSVIEKAKKIGPTVRLMTLKELEGGIWPVCLSPNFKRYVLTGLHVHKARFVWPPRTEIPFHDLRFAVPEDAIGYRTFRHLVEECVYSDMDLWFELGEGTHRQELRTSTDKTGWLLRLGSRNAEFEAVIDGSFTVERQVIPMIAEGYRQVGRDGADAWLVSAIGTVGEQQVDIRLALVPDEEGREYRPVVLRAKGMSCVGIYFSDESE